MLTSDLLVTRISGGKIEPAYARIEQGNIEIARSIIETFQDHVGRRYGELLEALEALEGFNYRMVRGLAQILERRCVIEADSVIDPLIARRMVFEESRGFVTDAESRADVIENVSRRIFVEPEELERALWSDHEENLILKEFRGVDPESLLRMYNLSLTQTLLFKATGMDISIEDGYQEVFRKIKQLGLMYSIQGDRIWIEGPVSIFRLTERYGTAIAKLLPTIVKSSRWRLSASILRKTFRGARVYEFALDHTKRDLLSLSGPDNKSSSECEFDSQIEHEFSRLSFPGWTLRREPGVLKAGPYVFIPDFALERRGDRVYVEIVGFWTPEYLRNKIQKLRMIEEMHKENLILIVNRNLSCSAPEFQMKNVLFFDRRIPHLEIIKILRRYEEKQRSEDMMKLRDEDLVLDGDVIDLNGLAQRYGVSTDALKEVISSKNVPYMLLGDQLVSDRILDRVRVDIKGVTRYSDSIKILDHYGIKAHGEALRVLGYRVRWTGLDPDSAEIEHTGAPSPPGC
ncbi:MAG: DUF790 family protein [Methanothrix sp.]|nr:DUF790 family protein [Methanothrix sp.]MCX8207439.1 DUF790 family protein [Methanothrix sp.]